MIKLIIICVFILFSPFTFAYKLADIARLKTTCSCPGCDLTDADLSNFKLGDSQTLILQKVKPNKDGQIVCDISHANFSGANLQNAYFSPYDFAPGINEKVGKIILKNTQFKNANLVGAHFNAVFADYSNFQNANLSKATILKSSSFKNSNFTAANLANISVTPPMGGCGANFSNSNFSQANLIHSRLNADFTQANFTNANLYGAELIPCDMDANSFQQTNFSGANLSNATNRGQILTANMLVNAKLCKTRLSQGVINRDCPTDSLNATK